MSRRHASGLRPAPHSPDPGGTRAPFDLRPSLHHSPQPGGSRAAAGRGGARGGPPRLAARGYIDDASLEQGLEQPA